MVVVRIVGQYISVSDRLYSVSWGTEITNNLTAISSNNLVYPQNSYTDTTHQAAGKGFYRVNVEVNE